MVSAAEISASGSGSLGRWLLLVAAVVAAPVVAAETLEFHFERLDRTYEDFVEDLTPIELGSMTISLSSPQHSFTVERHLATLEALGGNEFRARIELSFHGHGKLDADIEMGVLKSKLEDDLTLPSQSMDLSGRISIDVQEDGYLITLLEAAQHEVEVQIESRIASRIVPLCRQMALVLVVLDCDVLEQTLSVVRIPMPAAGQTFLLPREDLSDEEAAELEAFLKRSKATNLEPGE